MQIAMRISVTAVPPVAARPRSRSPEYWAWGGKSGFSHPVSFPYVSWITHSFWSGTQRAKFWCKMCQFEFVYPWSCLRVCFYCFHRLMFSTSIWNLDALFWILLFVNTVLTLKSGFLFLWILLCWIICRQDEWNGDTSPVSSVYFYFC